MKLEPTVEHAAMFVKPHLHLFNVLLAKKVPGQSGTMGYTQIINIKPLTYDEAARRIKGMLAPLGTGVLGFQQVVDCWMEPIHLDDIQFTSEEDRDAWLLAFAEGQKARRQVEAQAGVDPALLLELAELRGKVARLYGGLGPDPERREPAKAATSTGSYLG